MTVATAAIKGQFGSYRLDGGPLKVPGSARIYRIIGRKDVFYKEFHEPLRGAGEIARIEELVKVGAEFGKADLSSSRGRIAWPRDAVIEEGEVRGVVTTYAGDEFYNEPIGKRLMPRYLSHLRTPEEGVPLEVRLRLMRQLAGVLALLEHVDLVHGDLAAQNVLWKPDPHASVFLIDCDGMHSDSVPGNDGSTDGWTDPRKQEKLISSQDMRSDWFALALAIWRVTTLSSETPEHGPDGVTLPPETPRPFHRLLVRIFEDVLDPEPRPSPGEWVEALDEVLGSNQARRGLERLNPPQRRSAPRIQRRRPSPKPRPAPATPPPRSATTRRRPRKRILAVAAVLACLAVVGASFLDSGPSAAQVRAEKAVAGWTRSRLAVRRVEASCPGDSSLHAGARYVCRVETAGGGVAHVRVTVKHGGVTRHRLNLFAFRKRALVQDFHAGYRYFRRNGLDYGLKEITCPQTIASKPGTRFQCSARFTDGAKGKILGRMQGGIEGHYTWREAGTQLTGTNYALR
jgi:hypothetical protein